MSDMYAIKDTTLTALGDAVRNKVIGTTEQPTTSYPKTVLSFLGTYSFEFPAYVKKIKITGKLEHESSSATHSSLKGLGIVPFKVGSASDARLSEDFIIVIEETRGNFTPGYYESDFEIIIDSNIFTFVAATNNNANPTAYLTYTAIGLDENGNEFKYTPLEMADTINGLMTVPDEALIITGDCQYRFAYGGSDWLINMAGDKITTKDISDASYMFYASKTLERVPFEINLKSNANINDMFSNCNLMREFPQVNITTTAHLSLEGIFNYCSCMREIPEWFIDLLEEQYNLTAANGTFGKWRNLFGYCYSLRKIPERAMRAICNPKPSGHYYGVAYCKPFSSCRALDELESIACDNCSLTSNQFSNFFLVLNRVKNITFETNEDGTPVVRQWKSQTIDLSGDIGYAPYTSNILHYNSGITADKEVTDDATYQALKDDPDWFTVDINYSRYNHNSAVNTINSLPDTSAYGTNTIKFKGAAGALTDGGAINTMTEEEIAVASAKGWTVSLV